MLKSKKAEVIAAVEADLEGTTALIVTDYRGLSVAQLRRVRNELRPLDATVRVTKNTLAKIAAEKTGHAELARENRILKLKGAVLDGRVLDEDGVKRLATLPPKEVLQAQVLGTLVAPLAGIVSLLAAVPREFVVVLDQIIQKKQAEAA